MNDLYLYDSQGSCVYPEGRGSSREYRSVADTTVLRVDPDVPRLDGFTVVRVRNREQVIVRYEGKSVSQLFRDCRNRVLDVFDRDDFVERKTRRSEQPRKLFRHLVLEQESQSQSLAKLVDTTEEELKALKRLLNNDTVQPIKLRLDSYDRTADWVHTLVDFGASVAVRRNGFKNSDYDVEIVKSDDVDGLELDESAVELLEEEIGRRRAEQRRSRFERIEEEFEELAALNTSESAVRTELNERLAGTFESLRIGDINTGTTETLTDFNQPDSPTSEQSTTESSDPPTGNGGDDGIIHPGDEPDESGSGALSTMFAQNKLLVGALGIILLVGFVALFDPFGCVLPSVLFVPGCNSGGAAMSLTTEPVDDGRIEVTVEGAPGRAYVLSVSEDGEQVREETVSPWGNGKTKVTLGSFAPGTYSVKLLRAPGGEVLKNSKVQIDGSGSAAATPNQTATPTLTSTPTPTPTPTPDTPDNSSYNNRTVS